MSSAIRISSFSEPVVPFPWPMTDMHDERALVIEDDPDLRSVFRIVLRQVDPHLRLDWAAGVEDALRRLRRRTYSFVVADYLLDDGSGLVVKRWLDLFAPRLPFGMISAMPLYQELCSGNNAPVPFLPKPFSVDTLREFLNMLRDKNEA